MIESVRPATADDVDALVRIYAEARDELAAEKGGAVWAVREARRPPVAESLRAELTADDTLAVVGCIDDVVVGYGVARVEELTDGTRLGVVRDVVVEQGARRVGLGELVLTELVRWCASLGCIGVDALALPGARETKNFFEANGFSARALILHRSLRHDPPAPRPWAP
jgi:L-amino acid N-acyltransferase YncA